MRKICALAISLVAAVAAQTLMTSGAGSDRQWALHGGSSLETRSNKLSLVGRWAAGPGEAVIVYNGKVILGNGAYLEVLDVSAPEVIVSLAGIETPSVVNDIVISGDLAYVANGFGGLGVYDLSKPTEPREIGRCELEGYTAGVEVEGALAYVAAGIRLVTIDVSDPARPIVLGSYETHNRAVDVAVKGGYAYLAILSQGFEVLDVTDPSNPFKVADCQCSTLKDPAEIVMDGDYLYWADKADGFLIYDVHNAFTPTRIARFAVPNDAACVYVDQNRAYVGYSSKTLGVYDLSQPGSPSRIDLVDVDGPIDQLYVDGDRIYAAQGEQGFTMFEIGSDSRITAVGHYATGGKAWNLYVSGNYAYVADGFAGLRILDFSDPTRPVVAANFEAPGAIRTIAGVNSLIILGVDYAGLQFLDVHHPQSPLSAGQVPLSEYLNGVWVQGNYAYVASDKGLRIIDFQNPLQARQVGFFPASFVNDVFVVDQYAYLACYGYRLIILDISNPASPVEVGRNSGEGEAFNVYVSQNYAYMANGRNGLTLIDVSNPSLPVKVAEWPDMAGATSVRGVDAHLFVGKDRDLLLVDVSDPTQPVVIDTFSTGNYIYHMVTSGNYTYLATGKTGVYLLTHNFPTQPAQHFKAPMSLYINRPYPNPFNAATIISYSLPTAGYVKLEIYDIRGRVVATPVEAYQPADRYFLSFAKGDLPSGVYFYRLIFNGRYLKPHKMLLLK